jgi:hypothetical protein
VLAVTLKTPSSFYSVYIYWFICNLFNDAVSNSVYPSPNDCMIATNEFRKVWNEVVVAQFKILSQNLSRGNENHEKHENSRFRGRDSNRPPLKFKSLELPLAPISSKALLIVLHYFTFPSNDVYCCHFCPVGIRTIVFRSWRQAMKLAE